MDGRRWIVAASGLIVAYLMTSATIWADDARVVPFPRGYRSWQHVKSSVVGPEHPSFPRRGGIHHFYANERAQIGYRTGLFPNGSVIVDEGVYTKEGDGGAKGMLLEGDRRSVDVMVKNDRLYKDTAGWGFEHFEGQEVTGRLDAAGRSRCFECHAKSKDRDHVYSTIRP